MVFAYIDFSGWIYRARNLASTYRKGSGGANLREAYLVAMLQLLFPCFDATLDIVASVLIV